MNAANLSEFWAAVIAFAILIYVILDGYDLGVGILFGMTRDEDRRGQMMASIAPFWDGNETWLIVVGASLFGAFPTVYSVFLSAFYLPVLLLLVALIFRGVAFEFRGRTVEGRWIWDGSFIIGSTLAAFVQGAAIGAMIRGIPVTDGQFSGGPFEWLAPFPVFCGIGLVIGYSLLGASWLVLKGHEDLQEWAYRRIPWLVVGVVVVLIAAIVLTFDIRTRIESHIVSHSLAIILPIVGALALIGVLVAARKRWDAMPFLFTTLFFLAAYLMLAVMFWPYMIPYSITVANAAAPAQSLQFMFYAGIVVLPVILIYTATVYYVFRGKVGRGYS
jgi:cytochrome d ubiquinol oxidase subunit II